MRQDLERMIASGEDEDLSLAHTPWLEDPSPEDLEALYADYRLRHAVSTQEIVSVLGVPQKSLEQDADWFETWYPEAFAAAAWAVSGKWIVLAAEQADRETPVLLRLQCLTESSLEDLAS